MARSEKLSPRVVKALTPKGRVITTIKVTTKPAPKGKPTRK